MPKKKKPSWEVDITGLLEVTVQGTIVNMLIVTVCGGAIVTQSICRSDKIIMTNILQKCVVNWYHTYLLYEVMECTEATISQHY